MIVPNKHMKASLLVVLVLMFSVLAAACGDTKIETVEVIKDCLLYTSDAADE